MIRGGTEADAVEDPMTRKVEKKKRLKEAFLWGTQTQRSLAESWCFQRARI